MQYLPYELAVLLMVATPTPAQQEKPIQSYSTYASWEAMDKATNPKVNVQVSCPAVKHVRLTATITVFRRSRCARRIHT